MLKRLRLEIFAEPFRMICGAYPVCARSPSPWQRPAPTTIASRSPFPLCLCSCSTSLSKMGTKAAHRAAGHERTWGKLARYPANCPYKIRKIQSDNLPKIIRQIILHVRQIGFRQIVFRFAISVSARSLLLFDLA